MNKHFWKYTAIRALRTIAQAAVATIGSAAALGDVNWPLVVSASILAGILSVLTSIATGLPEVKYAEHVHMSAEEPDDSGVEEE